MASQIILFLFVVYFFFAWHYTYNHIMSSEGVQAYMKQFNGEQPRDMMKRSALIASIVGFTFAHNLIIAKRVNKCKMEDVKLSVESQISVLRGMKEHYQDLVDKNYLDEDTIEMLKSRIKSYEKSSFVSG